MRGTEVIWHTRPLGKHSPNFISRINHVYETGKQYIWYCGNLSEIMHPEHSHITTAFT